MNKLNSTLLVGVLAIFQILGYFRVNNGLRAIEDFYTGHFARTGLLYLTLSFIILAIVFLQQVYFGDKKK